MKKFFVLLPIFLVLLICGCASQDPVQVVKDSVTKLNSLNSYQVDYDYSLQVAQIMEMDGEMTIYKKGDNMRTDMGMSMMGILFTVSTYNLPTGTFSCTTFMENSTCIEGEGEQIAIFEPKSLENMEAMIEKNIVSLKFLNMGKVIDRSCYNISFDFDISRLGMLSEDELTAMGLNSTMMGDLENIETFKITECLDSATGMPLHVRMFAEMDMSKLETTTPLTLGKMIMEIDMTATSFKPNEAIPDSVFELPVEPTTIE